ncbi:hypothetical protein [Oryza sativa Japonica Group]|uniref:Uncharacterized protein n=1 Tax=Oryza sativa subsp. japonica TaxID=39947 RepID=Q5JLY3_ORYSJ|nr:hypothetical protein [Oryza sativa Japonica Group]
MLVLRWQIYHADAGMYTGVYVLAAASDGSQAAPVHLLPVVKAHKLVLPRPEHVEPARNATMTRSIFGAKNCFYTPAITSSIIKRMQ